MRTESCCAVGRNRSAAADLLGEPLSTRAQHKSSSQKTLAPFAGGQNFLKRGCAARALFSASESHRNTRARDACGPSSRARNDRHVALSARRSVGMHVLSTPSPAHAVSRCLPAAHTDSWHVVAAARQIKVKNARLYAAHARARRVQRLDCTIHAVCRPDPARSGRARPAIGRFLPLTASAACSK